MTDPNSPIVDFYPLGMIIAMPENKKFSCLFRLLLIILLRRFLSDFEVDMNGKRFAWQVCVYPIAYWFSRLSSTFMVMIFFLLRGLRL